MQRITARSLRTRCSLDAKEICEEVLRGDMRLGEISEIYLAYTSFKNTVVA